MRLAGATVAMLAILNTDALWLVAFLPAGIAAIFILLLLPGKAKPAPRVWQEGERHLSPRPPDWRPAHRESSPRPEPGKHQPGRGRHAHVSRQTQLEERTVSVPSPFAAHEHRPYRDGVRIRCEVCKLDLDQPEGQPEIGRHGFHSWS